MPHAALPRAGGNTTGGARTSRKLVLGPDEGGCFLEGLTTGGVLAQLLEQWSQRVQFRIKAGPVAGFQLLDSAIVVAQRLLRAIGLGAGEPGSGRFPRGRGGRGVFLEERCQRPGEPLVDEIVQVAAGPERMTVAEINALLYMPGHLRSELEKALRIPALSGGWRGSFQALLERERSGVAVTGDPGLPLRPAHRQLGRGSGRCSSRAGAARAAM